MVKGRQGIPVGYSKELLGSHGGRDGWVIKQQNMLVKKIQKVKEKVIMKSKRYLPLLMLYF